MKKLNEMTNSEKTEYIWKEVLSIEEGINANISELEKANDRIIRSITYLKSKKNEINKHVKHADERFEYIVTKANRIDNDVIDLDEKNNYEHSVMTKLIISSFAMHILIIIYLIIKGV